MAETNGSNSNAEVVTHRCRLALDRYIHEDGLLWTKLRTLLVMTASIGAGYGYMINSDQATVSALIAVMGSVTTIVMLLSLVNSRRYLSNYNQRFEKSIRQLFTHEPQVEFDEMPTTHVRTSTLAVLLALAIFAGWVAAAILAPSLCSN